MLRPRFLEDRWKSTANSRSVPPPENVSVTLTFELVTLKTYSVRDPTVRSICGSFGSNAFSGLGAVQFTRFLCRPYLWTHDLGKSVSVIHGDVIASSHAEHCAKACANFKLLIRTPRARGMRTSIFRSADIPCNGWACSRVVCLKGNFVEFWYDLLAVDSGDFRGLSKHFIPPTIGDWSGCYTAIYQ